MTTKRAPAAGRRSVGETGRRAPTVCPAKLISRRGGGVASAARPGRSNNRAPELAAAIFDTSREAGSKGSRIAKWKNHARPAPRQAAAAAAGAASDNSITFARDAQTLIDGTNISFPSFLLSPFISDARAKCTATIAAGKKGHSFAPPQKNLPSPAGRLRTWLEIFGRIFQKSPLPATRNQQIALVAADCIAPVPLARVCCLR